MIQIRAGDLVAVLHEGAWVSFAILTKQILFGGHWCFAYYEVSKAIPTPGFDVGGAGFNFFADFIVPKRQDRVARISRRNDFSRLYGPDALIQQPVRGETISRIWQWRNGLREDAEYVRSTPTPTKQEREAPLYMCFPADAVSELVKRGWKPGERWWVA